MAEHRFAFHPRYRLAALPFGVTQRTTSVVVEDGELRIRFGPWRLTTPVSNVKSTQVSDGYSFIKTAGPAHLSFTDRGVTFATSPGPGLCISFHEPVPAIDWVGVIKHPGATVTVEHPTALRKDLEG
jgi:hypothetical protein